MKIVLNKCYGGFGGSKELYKELGITWDGYGYLRNEDLGIKSDNYYEYRTSEKLIKAIEKIGVETASGDMAELKIIEIPDDVKGWVIDEYDGIETVEEAHRSW